MGLKNLISSLSRISIALVFVSITVSCTIVNSFPGVKAPLDDMTWVAIGKSTGSKNNLPKVVEVQSMSMMNEVERDLEKRVNEALDRQEFPKGKLLFLDSFSTENTIGSGQYKILFIFSFAVNVTPELKLDELFDVFLDGKNISEQVYYYSSFNDGRKKYLVAQGRYNPKGYLENGKEHQLTIKISDDKGKEHERITKFSVSDNTIKIGDYPQIDSKRTDGSHELKDDSTIQLGKAIKPYDGSIHPMQMAERGIQPIIPIASDNMDPDNYLGEIQRKKDKILSGAGKFPNDIMVFFNAKCFIGEESNPPDLIFSCLIPYGDFDPGEMFTLNLDGKDVSDKFRITQFPDSHRLSSLCIGQLEIPEFLDPKIEHTFEIDLKTFDGKKYSKRMDFKVPSAEVIVIGSAGWGFVDDGTGLMPVRDQMRVRFFFVSKDMSYRLKLPGWKELHPGDKYIEISGESFLDPASWILECEDGSPPPKIIRVEREMTDEISQEGRYILYFEEDIPFEHPKIYARIETSDGFRSQKVSAL